MSTGKIFMIFNYLQAALPIIPYPE